MPKASTTDEKSEYFLGFKRIYRRKKILSPFKESNEGFFKPLNSNCEVTIMCDDRAKRFGWQSILWKISGALLITLLCSPVYAQPANDDCDNAARNSGLELLFLRLYQPVSTLLIATLDPADPLLTCNAAGNDDGIQTVWWVYTPDASGFVDFNTLDSTEAEGGELDTAHGAFTGTCGDLVQVACVDVGLNGPAWMWR